MAEFASQTQPSTDRINFVTGLHWAMAAFFMVTDMTIGGMVSLPAPISRIGLSRGLPLLLLFAVLCYGSAILLGRCWQFTLRKCPQLCQKHCRRPYAEIGFCAFDRQWMRTLVSVGVNATQFGIATVFLLLCAVNVRHICLVLLHVDLSQCLWLLLLAFVLLPLTLLKSPNEFWPIPIGGLFCTVATFGVTLVGIFNDLMFNRDNATVNSTLGTPTALVGAATPTTLPETDFNCYMNAIGTLLFAFGGHPAIPTIQHDMKRPADFHKSATLAFSMITLFNLLIVLFACLAYGDSLGESVIGSIRSVWAQQVALVLITANSLLSITLVINPLNQEAEELFRTPQEFGFARLFVRSAVLASVLFVAESVPNFGPLLGFVGASTVPLMALLLPFLFHLRFSAAEMSEQSGLIWRKIRSVLLYGPVITFAVLIGIFATLSSLNALFGANFTMPCYLQQLSF